MKPKEYQRKPSRHPVRDWSTSRRIPVGWVTHHQPQEYDFRPRATGSDALRARFLALKHQWLTGVNPFLSDASKFVDVNYQCIIGIGPDVLPLLLEDLRTNGGDWFWALRAITGIDPVPDEHLGDLEAMREDWLEWARSRGLVH